MTPEEEIFCIEHGLETDKFRREIGWDKTPKHLYELSVSKAHDRIELLRKYFVK